MNSMMACMYVFDCFDASIWSVPFWTFLGAFVGISVIYLLIRGD